MGWNEGETNSQVWRAQMQPTHAHLAIHPYGDTVKELLLDLQMLGTDRSCDRARKPCSWFTRTLVHTPSPSLLWLPPEESALESEAHSVGVHEGIGQPRRKGEAWFTSQMPLSLTASESSNPCRYKLSYMEERGSKKHFSDSKGSTCSREDGWWGEGSNRAHQWSLSPHEGALQSSQSSR